MKTAITAITSDGAFREINQYSHLCGIGLFHVHVDVGASEYTAQFRTWLQEDIVTRVESGGTVEITVRC